MSDIVRTDFVRGLPIKIRDMGHQIDFSTHRGAADLVAARPTASRKKWLQVDFTEVDYRLRRRGVMTRLYESAARQACREGRRLVSDSTRSPFAEAFWRKQARKGRARCFIPNTHGVRGSNYFPNEHEVEHDIAHAHGYGLEPDYDRAQEVLRAMRLPRPRRDVHGVKYWPCYRWGLKRKLCKDRIVLEGLHRRV